LNNDGPQVVLDEEEIVQTALAEILPRLSDAAEYHTRMIYDEAPKKTLELAKSIRYFVKPDGSGYYVYVDKFYSAFNEFGTVKQRANPFLLRATYKALPGIIDILEGGGG
jgi:hypothetical protein